ncbi:MAG: D-tyrosyl-tRNA(Tyr) deacylase [Clostridiales bacterium GWF2_38_85]|nr:MAG: D-tyrosyl-tRNA(Tyr) deacylase [Clostridiales bacterium GWF2_38_85]HBL83894.1 D-tyrosyl-tRNA(Tyr) deacylase [Clostridiales bacterium]
MILIVQRVNSSKLWADGKFVAEVGKGLVVFAGIFTDDSDVDINKAVEKVSELRIFENENCKMDLSVRDIKGEVMLVPNFTVCGDTSHGRRPDFIKAARPEQAKPMFEQLYEKINSVIPTKEGVFGSDMRVVAENDGPVTILIDTKSKLGK